MTKLRKRHTKINIEADINEIYKKRQMIEQIKKATI